MDIFSPKYIIQVKTMKKKMMAMILAALMIGAMMVAAPCTAASAIPVGTDLFADKNPSLETVPTTHKWDWKYKEGYTRKEHDKTAPGYDASFGDWYYHISTDFTGGQMPWFTGLEGGRHYYLSFYVRNAARKDAILSYSYLKKTASGDYGYYKNASLEYKWKDEYEATDKSPLYQFVYAKDVTKWTKLTFDIILPPNADGVKLDMFYAPSLHNGGGDSTMDADNFSLIAGEYLSDNLLKNGSLDNIRTDGDPIHWDYDNVGSGSNTKADGNGGYYIEFKTSGALKQPEVWLVGGKQYKVTFKFRSNSGIRPCGIGIDGVYYPSINKTADKGVRSTHNDGWEQFTTYFTAPGEAGVYAAHTFAIGLRDSGFYGSAGVGIDDVVLTEAEGTAVSYVKDVPGKWFYEKGYDVFYQNPYVDTANGLLWWRGTEEDAITDFAAVNGVHPVAVNAYHFPKTAGEKISLISAVYKENAVGVKQLVNVKVTAATAADTNPMAITHTVDVKEADAASAWVESFIWTDMTKLLPASNSVYTLDK